MKTKKIFQVCVKKSSDALKDTHYILAISATQAIQVAENVYHKKFSAFDMTEKFDVHNLPDYVLDAQIYAPRKITSHKGGRTEIISSMRVTPGEKQMIDEARKDLSYADYLVKKASKDVRRKNP